MELKKLDRETGAKELVRCQQRPKSKRKKRRRIRQFMGADGMSSKDIIIIIRDTNRESKIQMDCSTLLFLLLILLNLIVSTTKQTTGKFLEKF